MKSKKPEFARVFIYNLLIIILVTVGAIVSFWIYQTYDDFGKKVKTLRKDYIEKKKREIRNEVIRITNYIDYRKNIITRDKKINLTCEFKKLYYNIFQYYNDNKTLPKEKLRQNILNIINSDNFNNNKYFTIAYILDKNKLEVNKLIRRNGKYRKVPAHDPSITKLIYSYKHEDLGNDEYLWYLHGGGGFNCINSNKLQYIKLGLVKYFKPLNIYIMLAAYAENLVKKIQDDILGWINRLSFPRNHYFFIDTYEGTSLVFDGKRVGKSSEAPIREKYLKNYRKKAQKIIDTHKRGYLYYPVPTKNGKLLYNKISYIETMDDWDWIVGSGFYMEDIENEIKIMREKLEIKTIYNISHIVLFLLFFIVISLLIAHFLIRKAKKSFSQFNDFFKKSASSSALIDPDKQTYREFKQLADSANSMIKKRKEIEEALIYSRHQFKDIAESMADWIWEIDKHLRYKYVSGKVKKLLGYDPEQCLGEFFSTIYLKDCEKTAKNNFTEKIEKKEVIEDFDIWINTVDGKRVCLQTNAIPFDDEA
ncbi:MAG: cache domain-containing protein, partial [Victivallales bacterium]|nr:cache domain-containing protein [Victivallales bacterium]